MKSSQCKITVQITKSKASALRTIAKMQKIDLEAMLAQQIYANSECLLDGPFWFLEAMEEACADNEARESFIVTFCPEVYALLERTSRLLRREISEYASEIAYVASSTAADYLSTYLEKGDDFSQKVLEDYATDAVLFAHAAKRNIAPQRKGYSDCWELFSIPDPKKKPRAKATASEIVLTAPVNKSTQSKVQKLAKSNKIPVRVFCTMLIKRGLEDITSGKLTISQA